MLILVVIDQVNPASARDSVRSFPAKSSGINVVDNTGRLLQRHAESMSAINQLDDKQKTWRTVLMREGIIAWEENYDSFKIVLHSLKAFLFIFLSFLEKETQERTTPSKKFFLKLRLSCKSDSKTTLEKKDDLCKFSKVYFFLYLINKFPISWYTTQPVFKTLFREILLTFNLKAFVTLVAKFYFASAINVSTKNKTKVTLQNE